MKKSTYKFWEGVRIGVLAFWIIIGIILLVMEETDYIIMSNPNSLSPIQITFFASTAINIAVWIGVKIYNKRKLDKIFYRHELSTYERFNCAEAYNQGWIDLECYPDYHPEKLKYDKQQRDRLAELDNTPGKKSEYIITMTEVRYTPDSTEVKTSVISYGLFTIAHAKKELGDNLVLQAASLAGEFSEKFKVSIEMSEDKSSGMAEGMITVASTEEDADANIGVQVMMKIENIYSRTPAEEDRSIADSVCGSCDKDSCADCTLSNTKDAE